MALFKRKMDDEDYEDEEYEEIPRRRRAKDRDFKDLKPENKRRRKEPKKPWGKKERILVLLAIIITAGTSFLLSLSSYSWKLPGLPRLKFPSISLPSFFREETIVIEGRKKDQEKADKVIAAFKDKTKNLSGVYGFYVVRLDNGFYYGVNESEIFEPASLNKLPIMAGLFMEAEAGNLNLDEKYTLKASDKIAGSGNLYSRPVGFQITYRNLIRLMGKESDNTAFNIAKNYLGDEKIRQIVTRIGMTRTDLAKNETTPADIGAFFKELWNGNIMSAGHKEELLEYLTDTIYEAWIPEGVPDEVRVAHKYGREVHVVNDAGIVFANEPFVVVIMSKGVVDREVDAIFPELAKAIFDIETSQ